MPIKEGSAKVIRSLDEFIDYAIQVSQEKGTWKTKDYLARLHNTVVRSSKQPWGVIDQVAISYFRMARTMSEIPNLTPSQIIIHIRHVQQWI